MKTNVIMKSTDRTLFNVIIRQSTNGFLNLSDLQEAYAHARIKHGWVDKNITMILNSGQNSERMFYLLEKKGYINVSFLSFMESIKDQGIAHYLKKIGAYKTTGARKTKTTWCDPYLWVLIAMELNPMLYAETVVWLTDRLIINRIEAGNFYKSLTSAISKFNNVDYVKMAKALNYIVFNNHYTGIRNNATEKELLELEELEKHVAFSIEVGFLHSFDQLILFLRKCYNKKWGIPQ